MLDELDRTILEILIGQLATYGVTEINLCVGYLAHLIRAPPAPLPARSSAGSSPPLLNWSNAADFVLRCAAPSGDRKALPVDVKVSVSVVNASGKGNAGPGASRAGGARRAAGNHQPGENEARTI